MYQHFLLGTKNWKNKMKKVDQKYYWHELTDASSPYEISTSEYCSLAKFLRTDGVPGGCNSLAMADGFLTALVGGPEIVPRKASDNFHLVWGATQEQAVGKAKWSKNQERMLDILYRRAGNIVFCFDCEPTAYKPLVGTHWREISKTYSDDGSEVPDVIEWCQGFVSGLKICSAAWTPIFETRLSRELIAPFLFLGTDDGWTKLNSYDISNFSKNLSLHVMRVRDFFQLPFYVRDLQEKINTSWNCPKSVDWLQFHPCPH
jgi:yecA family protein